MKVSRAKAEVNNCKFLEFVHLLRDISKVRATKEGQQQLLPVWKYGKPVFPWFPAEGSMRQEISKGVCERMSALCLGLCFDCYFAAVLFYVFMSFKFK